MIFNNFQDLINSDKKYDIIVADPPWKFKTYSEKGMEKSPEQHYNTMTWEDLENMPIDLISKDNCVLLMWATDPLLNKQIELPIKWGFTYKTMGFVWVKENKKSKSLFWGLGYYTRCLDPNCKVWILHENRVKYVSLSELSNIWNDALIWGPLGWKKIYNYMINKVEKAIKHKTISNEYTYSPDHKWFVKRNYSKRVKHNRNLRIRHPIIEEMTGEKLYKRIKTKISNKTASTNLLFSKTPILNNNILNKYENLDLNYNAGYFIGLFCAEGNYQKNCYNSIRFSIHQKETFIFNKIKSYVDSLNLYSERYNNTKVNVNFHNMKNTLGMAVYLFSKELSNLLRYFILNEGAKYKRLNLNEIFNTSVEFRKGILDGMLEGDGVKLRGTHKAYSNHQGISLCNLELLQDYKILCESIGIEAKVDITPYYYEYDRSKSRTKLNIKKTYCYRMYFINYGTEIKDAKYNCIPMKNKNIEYIDYNSNMVDLTVEDQAFIVNGAITHNCNPEYCLLFTKGNPPRPKVRNVLKIILDKIREHSRKPDSIMDHIDSMWDGDKLEMFARNERNGWDSFGNEVTKF